MNWRLWLLVICGIVIVMLAGGTRLSFGVLLQPISTDLEIDRQAFGLVIALQALIFGLAQPFVGYLADRFGALIIITLSSAFFALGLWLSGQSTTALELGLSLGIIVGLALSGTTQVVILGAVGRAVPDRRQGTAFGLIIAAQSLGMFLVVPGTQNLVDAFSWRSTMTILAIVVLILPILAIGLRTRATPDNQDRQPSVANVLSKAKSNRSYLLLTAGFFVCGFHVTFIAVHLPAYFVDQSISPQIGASALALIGLFNIVGAYVFGMLGDRYRKKNLLVLIYLGRALLMGSLLFVPVNNITALIFSAIMGVIWLGTVPLTSGLVAQMFGTRHFSMLFGVVFLGHQLGSFAGAWLGGVIYDITGSYDGMWVLSVALALLAAGLNWPIVEHPIKRLIQPALMALGITPTPIRLHHSTPLELRAVGMDARGQSLAEPLNYQWDISHPGIELKDNGAHVRLTAKEDFSSAILTVTAQAGKHRVRTERLVSMD